MHIDFLAHRGQCWLSFLIALYNISLKKFLLLLFVSCNVGWRDDSVIVSTVGFYRGCEFYS